MKQEEIDAAYDISLTGLIETAETVSDGVISREEAVTHGPAVFRGIRPTRSSARLGHWDTSPRKPRRTGCSASNHRTNIMQKLGLSSIVDLVRYAEKNGLAD